MAIEIPSTGKPCAKCGKNNGNPLHDGVCNVCYSNALFRDPAKYKSSSANDPKTSKNILDVLGILFGLFILWMIFGGLFEDQSSYTSENTTHIDCSNPEINKYSKYCNGEYERENQEQNFKEDRYYNSLR